MDVVVIGCGNVGMATAAGLHWLGHSVTCVDDDPDVIKAIENGEDPTSEGVEAEYFQTADEIPLDADVYFVAVPTPKDPEDGLDMSAVTDVVGQIPREKTTAIRSTIMPTNYHPSVGHVPEFMREGHGLDDFMSGRLIFGGDHPFQQTMMDVFTGHQSTPELMSFDEAAMVKLATNSFKAAKISIANDIGMAADKLDIDGEKVMAHVSNDDAVAAPFTAPGPPWGGGCFPKDLRAMTSIDSASTLSGAMRTNDRVVNHLVGKIRRKLDKDDTLAILGFGFKPNSANTKESLGMKLLDRPWPNNAIVGVDPYQTIPNVTMISPRYVDDHADVAIIANPWDGMKTDFEIPVVDPYSVTGEDGDGNGPAVP